MSRSGSETKHQGADLREQLQSIVHAEMEAFADIDKVANVEQLQFEVNQFMQSLQKRMDGYIQRVEQENADTAAEAAEQKSVESALASSTHNKDFELSDEEIMNLDEEFRTYGIKQANGIFETKRSRLEIMKQTLIGAAIAVALMWVFWPATEQQQAVVIEEVITEAAEPTVAANSDEKPAAPVVEAKVEKSVEPQVTAKREAVEVAAEPVVVAEKVQPKPVTAAKEAELIESVVASYLTGEKIKVTAHYGNVRNAPDNSGKVISRLKKGEVVEKLDEKDGWFHVRLNNEKVAWVHKSLFSPRLRVAANLGNIRSKPTAKGEIVTRLKRGDYVTKTGEQKGWYQVKLDSGKTAWAHRSIF